MKVLTFVYMLMIIHTDRCCTSNNCRYINESFSEAVLVKSANNMKGWFLNE